MDFLKTGVGFLAAVADCDCKDAAEPSFFGVSGLDPSGEPVVNGFLSQLAKKSSVLPDWLSFKEEDEELSIPSKVTELGYRTSSFLTFWSKWSL
ncbi:hypothetical protein WICPIJ_008724 [Wickerhamomyces pijperi]|uniref:Uncharacterized protein n=1 Tax=Wickerhamomyces pijperi TaxID=599730 RepID=A0A9P8TI19_WICPI|nr:hypothetical protein WICPIJ_008724 [Wickerhamomyces pijperi]